MKENTQKPKIIILHSFYGLSDSVVKQLRYKINNKHELFESFVDKKIIQSLLFLRKLNKYELYEDPTNIYEDEDPTNEKKVVFVLCIKIQDSGLM